jgi:periplasmic protein TonB
VRLPTVVLSGALHVGLAVGLVAVAQKRELQRKAISVAVTEEKKKEAKPKPPPPPPPRVIARPVAPKVVAVVAKEEPVAVHAPKAAPAPVATSLTMSNDDAGPGIGLLGRAPARKAAPAPVKLASAISDRRTHRAEDQAGDEPCNEEPTRPEAVFKAAIDYSLHPQAQADGIEGVFRARLTVDANGEVSKVEVLAGLEPGLDAAVVAALKTWRFKPAMACGKPVAGSTFVLTRTFELAD